MSDQTKAEKARIENMENQLAEQTISDYKNLIEHDLASLVSRVGECDSHAARYIVDAKMNIELLNVTTNDALRQNHENYNEQYKLFKDRKATYYDLNNRLLDLVTKFVNECKCSK